MTSFFSYSSSSIKLGLFHSLFSFISFSAPLILCAYVLWKYGYKYGLRAYLAVTFGQTVFLLFLFYGPYFLTYNWYLFEPFLTMFGAFLLYNFLYYMDKDKRFEKFPTYYYYFFVGIMFLNPIRLGNFMALSPISMILLNKAPTFLYCLFFSTSFFILNFSLGLILVYFLNNSIFLLLNENKIKKIFYNLLLVSVIYIFFKFPIYIYYQYPFSALGFPVIAPPFNNSTEGPFYIANIPITILKNNLLEKPYLFAKKIYDLYMGWGFSFISENITNTEEEPNRNIYFKHEAFIRDKNDEIETDIEDLENELAQKKGKNTDSAVRIKDKVKKRLVWRYPNVECLYTRFELCDELLMNDMWISKRLQFRTPKYLNLTRISTACLEDFTEIKHLGDTSSDIKTEENNNEEDDLNTENENEDEWDVEENENENENEDENEDIDENIDENDNEDEDENEDENENKNENENENENEDIEMPYELLHETENFKGHDISYSWFKNEESQKPVLWVRYLYPRNYNYSLLSFFNSLPIDFFLDFIKTSVDNHIRVKQDEFVLTYPHDNLLNFLKSDSDFYENFSSNLKLFVQNEILVEKKIERNNLTTEDLNALNLLSEIIIKNEFLIPLKELDINSKFQFEFAQEEEDDLNIENENEDEWDVEEETSDILYEEELLETVLDENSIYLSTTKKNEEEMNMKELISKYEGLLTLDNMKTLSNTYYKRILPKLAYLGEEETFSSEVQNGLSFHEYYNKLLKVRLDVISPEKLLANPNLILKEPEPYLHRERVEETDVIKGVRFDRTGYVFSQFLIAVQLPEEK